MALLGEGGTFKRQDLVKLVSYTICATTPKDRGISSLDLQLLRGCSNTSLFYQVIPQAYESCSQRNRLKFLSCEPKLVLSFETGKLSCLLQRQKPNNACRHAFPILTLDVSYGNFYHKFHFRVFIVYSEFLSGHILFCTVFRLPLDEHLPFSMTAIKEYGKHGFISIK